VEKSVASYSGCRVVVTYDDGRARFEDDDCDVSLEDDELLVTYWDERGPVVLQGRDRGESFAVTARSRPSTATLRRQGGVFEGTWRERDDSGRLRIELGFQRKCGSA
jgi:hypothetical protein